MRDTSLPLGLGTPVGIVSDLLPDRVEDLNQRILARTGHDFGSYRVGFLERRIGRAIRNRRASDVDDYIRMLEEDPQEYDNLLNSLTIRFTSFFRNPKVFELTRRKVIPKLLDAKRCLGLKMIRAWSAGCATGEETYSLAMVLSDALEGRDDLAVSVIGTDIDGPSLMRARTGMLDRKAMDQIPERLRERFVVETLEGPRMSPEIMGRTRFMKRNLVTEAPLKGMDIVFCRNVMIYFKRSLQEEVLAHLSESLSKGGVLVLGMVEGMLGPAEGLFSPVSVKDRIFVRAS